MSSFDDRESAFENKFVHDAETQFKMDAHTNKLLGQWAAAELGKPADEVSAYVLEVIKSDFEEAGHEDVIRKVKADLEGKVNEDTIRAKLAEFTEQTEAEFTPK